MKKMQENHIARETHPKNNKENEENWTGNENKKI